MQCPDCGATVDGVETYGPAAHVFDPCGCSVGTVTPSDLADADRGRDVATDGGLDADNVIDSCDLCGENKGVTSEDVVNEKTGERTTAWLCPECIDRLERYNRGEEDALEEVVAE